jgi:hypothetical protein
MDEDIPIPISSENRITPQEFDGQQGDVFKSGMRYYVTLLRDVNRVLLLGNETIVWRLGTLEAVVSSSSITQENRCDVKYEGLCPLWVEGFCSDGDYCNGEETCFADTLGQASNHVIGRCDRPVNGIQCSVSQVCSNEENRCVAQTPPPPPPPSIIPSFTCWFYTYEENNVRMVMNIQMGYNNTGTGPLVRLVTVPESSPSTIPNKIVPTPYNGIQPTLFMVGYKPDSFVIRDEANVLELDGTIQWFLTDYNVTISQTNISPSTKCYSPDDDVVVPPTTGGGGGEETSDSDLEGQQCSEGNTDCTSYDTFCGGVTTCHVESGNCVQEVDGFNPCMDVQNSFPPGIPLAINCVEQARICTATINCTIDQECADNDFCNGQEFCINGTCEAEANFTCGPGSTCNNETGCSVVNQPISSEALIGVMAGAVILFVAVVLIIYVFFWSTGRTRKSKNK